MGSPRLLLAAGLGYLAGTFPSADVACRVATGGSTDLRLVGSRNPGANNAIKVLGPRWGYGVMVLDIAKGAVACVAGRAVAGGNGAHVGGVAAVVGHCFPAWNGFRGGKGVATSVGQCAATFPAWSFFDLLVAWAAAVMPWWKRRHVGATVVSSTIWVAASALWWRRGWPNLWGPAPTVAMPLAAAATSAVILYRLATEPPPLPPAPGPQAPPDGGDREPRVPRNPLPALAVEEPLP
ncbi:MAG: glycerol-3-phosphate acyltransferase [Actinomycetota bacterium]|nr:glycerol-3-phosphate acyltransferase [Actinomycetota bacterium]